MNEQILHPYCRYAESLILLENNLPTNVDLTSEQIKGQIEKGINTFRMQPIEAFEGKEKVKYDYVKQEKGKPSEGVFLSSSTISSDKLAHHLWKSAKDILSKIESNEKSLSKKVDAKMSFAPIAGEFTQFTFKKIGRGNPKITLYDAALSTVTTLTTLKPCLRFIEYQGGEQKSYHVCFIPDLPIDKMKGFIEVFKRMMEQRTNEKLLYGQVKHEEKKNGKITYTPKRPLIFKGNFPDPPESSALGSVALLGAIGEFAKDAKYSEKAKSVLEDLKGTTMYMIKYGDASTFSYNHHVIDLAKAGKLKTLVDSIYYSILHSVGKRFDYNQKERIKVVSEYQKFDLFTSRFLQLFNRPALQDFLSFRAEYPKKTEILLTTYFKKVENMETLHSGIVESAKSLGQWLNRAAKIAAFEDIKTHEKQLKHESKEFWRKYQQVKSKFLVELESSAFSARSGDALCMQVIRRAGLLSNSDVPAEASLFMEKTASGQLELDKAKNLLIAFSRLKSEEKDKKNVSEDITKKTKDEPTDRNSKDYSEI